MALSQTLTNQTASSIAGVCTDLAKVLAKIDVLLEYNSDLSIDWGGDPLPDYIVEDDNGNISGYTFSRGDVSNAIFSLLQVRNLLTNVAPTQGDHLGNVNKLSKPMPITR